MRQRRGLAICTRQGLLLAVSIVLPLIVGGCGRSYEQLALERARYAGRGVGSVYFAAIDDAAAPSYLDGVRLAVDRINAVGGVLGGRRLEVMVYPGGERFEQVYRTAERIAADPRLTAVLGHRDARVAIPASVIYQAALLLFLPPFVTATTLTRHGFDLVLRMLPDNAVMAAQSASVAALFGYRRIAVLHARDDNSREQAFLFEDAARQEGVDIVFHGSFFLAQDDYRDLLGQLDGVAFDALYLSTETAAGARLLTQLRGLGLRQPVLGSDRLAAGDLQGLAARAAEPTLVPVVFSADAADAPTRRFVETFEKVYGRAPDAAAAQGSDSVELLAYLIDQAGSTDPRVLSTTARYGPPWAGVTGIYAFDPSGNLFGKSYRFEVLQFGRWWPLPGVTAPYRLASLDAYRRERARTLARVATTAGDAPRAPLGEAATGTAVMPPPDGSNPPAEQDLIARERYLQWLARAQDILNFKRLGLVVPPSEEGREAAQSVASVAQQRGFSVATCELPAAAGAAPATTPAATAAGAGPLERAALACYSRLAPNIDAMLTVVDGSLTPDWLRQLNVGLRAYGVPAFALAPSLAADYSLTLALVGSGVDLQDPGVEGRFGGLLQGLRIHELNRLLSNLPTVSLDLGALAALKRRPDPRELTVVSRVLESGASAPMGAAQRQVTTFGGER